MWIIFIALHILFTHLVAKQVGEKRKIGYKNTALIGLFSSPLLALLIALLSPLIDKVD